MTVLTERVFMERETVRKIKEAVRNGTLGEPLTPKEVNRAIGINYAGAFLPKHRLGGPRPPSEQHFVRVGRGQYTLRK